MNNRALLLIAFVLLHMQGTAQTRNDVWALGDSILLEMGPDGFVFSRTIPFYERLGVTSICDTAGNLLYYSSSTTAFNRNGDTLQNGWNLAPESNLVAQGCMTVPVPGDPHKYYLMSLGYVGESTTLRASIVDMTLDSGLGGVLSGFKSRQLVNGLGEQMQIVRHGNGKDWWVLVRPVNPDSLGQTKGFLLFQLTGDSILGPWLQDVGQNSRLRGGGFAASVNGERLALSSYSSNLIQVFAFDRCSGIISEEAFIYDSIGGGYWGIAYGPESQVLYGIRSDPRVINQFFPNGDGYNQHEIGRYGTKGNHFLSPPELGPDGRVYVASGAIGVPPDTTTYYLGVIREPTLEGQACTFDTFGIWLGGANYEAFGLPNQANFKLGVLEGSSCDTSVSSIPPLVESSETWSVYPNPFQDRICLESERSAQPDQLALFDIAGRLVWEQTSSASTTETTHCYAVPQTLASGTYTLHIQTGNTTEVLRVEAAGH